MTIEGIGIPNDKTVGEVGDIYVDKTNKMSYELIYIGTITTNEGESKIYDWRPIHNNSGGTASGLVLTDKNTEKKYGFEIIDGNLTMEEVTE